MHLHAPFGFQFAHDVVELVKIAAKRKMVADIEQINDMLKPVTYFYTYDKRHQLIKETTSLTPSILEFNHDDPAHVHAASQASSAGVNYPYDYDTNCNQTMGPDFSNPAGVGSRTLT